MKDEITNIINLESITRVRSSLSVNANLPTKNSIVKLIPLEYLEQGVKVLIDGKFLLLLLMGKFQLRKRLSR